MDFVGALPSTSVDAASPLRTWIPRTGRSGQSNLAFNSRIRSRIDSVGVKTYLVAAASFRTRSIEAGLNGGSENVRWATRGAAMAPTFPPFARGF